MENFKISMVDFEGASSWINPPKQVMELKNSF